MFLRFSFIGCFFITAFLIIFPNFILAEENYSVGFGKQTLNKNEDDYELNRSRSLPTNPFELVDLIRSNSSMDDATLPSDAIDQALDTFDQEILD